MDVAARGSTKRAMQRIASCFLFGKLLYDTLLFVLAWASTSRLTISGSCWWAMESGTAACGFEDILNRFVWWKRRCILIASIKEVQPLLSTQYLPLNLIRAWRWRLRTFSFPTLQSKTDQFKVNSMSLLQLGMSAMYEDVSVLVWLTRSWGSSIIAPD